MSLSFFGPDINRMNRPPNNFLSSLVKRLRRIGVETRLKGYRYCVEIRLKGYKYFEIKRDFFNNLGVLIDGDFKLVFFCKESP
jgi:hypothetical protein